MSNWKEFGGTPAKRTTLPEIGTCNARCFYIMLNVCPLTNEKLGEYGMANASRRSKDLVEIYGVRVMTRTKHHTRPDGARVRVSEYRVDPEWINGLVGDSEQFRTRLLLWADAQEKHEQKCRTARKAADAA